MRRRTRRALALAAAVVVGFAAASSACGSFDRALPEAPEAGLEASADAPQGVDGGGLIDAVAPDASGTDGSAPPPPICPPPAGPGCPLAGCARRTLYVPDMPSWPFGMVTDAASVYWLEQRGAPGEAYNGNGAARVMRVDRVGSPTASRAAVLVGDQAGATVLARLGGYLYWTTWNQPTSTSTLRRVSASCAPPCQDASVGTYANRLFELVGVEGKGLVAIAGDGTVVRFAVDAAGAVSPGVPVMKSSTFPGLAVTGALVYASGLYVNKVSRADLGTGAISAAWATLAFDAGAEIGLTHLTTNCVDLFGFHNNGTLERVNLGTSAVSRVASLGTLVYGAAQDANFVYAASQNGGGLVAIDPASNQTTTLAAGSFQSIATDATGVYWADHPNAGGGTVTMLVK